MSLPSSASNSTTTSGGAGPAPSAASPVSSSSSVLQPRHTRVRRQCGGVCADPIADFTTMQRAYQQDSKNANTNSTTTAAAASTIVAASSSSSSSSVALPCPATSASLGRAGWTVLHTMSAYYPEKPTPLEQSRMASLITNFAAMYPCHDCSTHFQQHLVQHPPPTQTRGALSLFLCNYHNDVNRRLNKKQFDCSRYDERWRDEQARDDCVEKTLPDEPY